jgi:hypothetical protein
MKKIKSNSEKIWKIKKKRKLKCEMIWKIWKRPVSRAAAAAATTTSITTAAAASAATRLLENPVEATTIVQNFVLLLFENVV